MLHITSWLKKSPPIPTLNGQQIEVWELKHQKDDKILSAWAKHFREQYCESLHLDDLRDGTGLSRAEFLRTLIFPDRIKKPGPSIRSGDFAELLVADYLAFSLNYWVPRTRMKNKSARNESIKGCDVIGFQFTDRKKFSANDVLAIYESKAKLGQKSVKNRLQHAVDDSAKDNLRKAESLVAIKSRLLNEGKINEASKIKRFQNSEDNPYVQINGAVAVIATAGIDTKILEKTSINNHPNKNNLKLLVIHGADLMKFMNDLFERAANEA